MKFIENLIMLSALAYVHVLNAQNNSITKLDLGIARPAFTVSLSVHTTLTTMDEIVKFDRVILNRGIGYDPRTGIFTAPLSGLYQISATIMSSYGSKLHAYIAQNDVYLMDMYGPPLHGSTGTTNLVLELKKGDRITVKHRFTVSEVIYGDNYCHFSGFYISE